MKSKMYNRPKIRAAKPMHDALLFTQTISTR